MKKTLLSLAFIGTLAFLLTSCDDDYGRNGYGQRGPSSYGRVSAGAGHHDRDRNWHGNSPRRSHAEKKYMRPR